MPPTRMGTPMASEAATMPALTSASVKGSTAVEFSGHTTRSGRGARPASTSAASCSVRATWLAVISRCTAGTSVPSPGTSPWTAATVSSSPRVLTPGTASYDRSSGSRVTAAMAADERPARPGGRRSRLVTSQASGRAGERDQQADPGHAEPRDGRLPHRVGGRVGQPTPGQPPEGPGAAPRLDRDPGAGRPHRPGAQPGHQRQDHAQGREVEGLEERQRHPRVGADRAHPPQQGAP